MKQQHVHLVETSKRFVTQVDDRRVERLDTDVEPVVYRRLQRRRGGRHCRDPDLHVRVEGSRASVVAAIASLVYDDERHHTR